MQTPKTLRAPARRFGFLGAAGAALVLSLLSCGREITGPNGGLRFADGLSFVAEFPGEFASVEQGAGAVVPYTSVRVVFSRANGDVALARTLAVSSAVAELEVSLSVPLAPDAPSTGEELDLTLQYINATGDTVFRGGPARVLARVLRRGETAPTPTPIALTYTGPGASATSVAIAPDTIALEAGAPFTFTATARDGQGGTVANAPLIFSALDVAKATLASGGAGAGVTLATRGEARVRVALAAGGAADTALLLIAPKPNTFARVGSGTPTGVAGTVLPDSVVVRLLATDGLPIAGAQISVAILGGGSTSDSSLVTDSDGRAAVKWTLGSVLGTAAQSLTFSSAGVSNVVVSATATAALLPAREAFINEQPTTGIALTNFGQISVQARDSLGGIATNYTSSVTLNFIQVPSGATVTGPVGATAINGVATFNGLAPNKVGTYRFTASGFGLIPDTSLAIVVAAGAPTVITLSGGGEQSANVNTALSAPIVVRVADGADNPVPNRAVTFAIATGGGSLTGAVDTTDANGLAFLGSWTLGATPGPQTITATVAGVSPLTITATAIAQAPIITLSVAGSNVIGFGRTGALNVRLGQPAPAGGLVVGVQSDSTQYLTVAAPGTLTIPAGDTLGTIEVTGVAVGTARVRAGATAWEGDTINVPVSLNLISLPTTLNVPLGQTVSLPVQLTTAAPAEGVAVAVASANPLVASVSPATATIAAGGNTVNVNVTGNALGSTTMTASNANYAQDVVTVNVTASVDIIATSITLNQSFGTTVGIRVASGGNAVPAPPGGVLLNLSSANEGCAVFPATATIPQGNSTVTVPVTAGTGPTFPCTTRLFATGPEGFGIDSVSANVAATPALTLSAFPLGSGLQRTGSVTLGTGIHGGTTVRIASSNPAKLLIAPNASSPGAAFVDVPINVNGISGNYVYQALEGILNDSVSITASAPGFVSDTQAIRIYRPIYSIFSLLPNRTTAQADNVFTINVGTPTDSNSVSFNSFDVIRTGGVPIEFSVVNDSIPYGDLVTTALVGDSVTVTIPVGESGTANSVALGGIAFRSQATGTARVRASTPSARAGNNTIVNVTTEQSSISTLTAFAGSSPIGRGLQRLGTVSLSNTVVGTAVPVKIKAGRPGFVLLSPNSSTLGTADSIEVLIGVGASAANFTLQVLDSAALDTLTLTATAPGYSSLTSQVQVLEPVIRLSGLNTTGTTSSADDVFQVEIGSPNSPTGTSIVNFDAARFGGPGIPVSVISDSIAVGRLSTTGGIVDSTAISIVPGSRFTAASVAAGGVAFRYLGPGTAIVRAQSAFARELTAAQGTITVSQPSISALTSFGLGAGLARATTITLDAPAPTGGLPVTMTASEPGLVKFAINGTTIGSDTLVAVVPQGLTSLQVVVQAMDVLPDTVVITASSPGWTSRNANIFIWPAVIQISGLLSTNTTLSGDDAFAVQIGSPSSATGTTISASNPRYFGAPPLPVTLRSSNGLVARFVTSAVVTDSVVVNIVAGANQIPGTVASGGVALRPISTGTTVISANAPGVTLNTTAVGSTVVINAPVINVPTSQPQVGAGLQVSATSLSLNAAQHGGVNVVVRSSNPSVLKLARTSTEPGADSIVVAVADGSATIPVVLVGMEGQTGSVQLTASAPGFVDGSGTITVVTPAFDILNLSATQTAGAADDPFTVRVGVPNNLLTSISTQSVRVGSSGVTVTLTSTNPTVGTLVSTALTASPQTIVIPAGTASGPGTVALGGLAFKPLTAGTTSVSASAPGFASVTAGTINITVNAP